MFSFKNLSLIVFVSVIGLAGANAALAKSTNSLKVVKTSSASYICDDKSKVTAQFYQLSDESLHFVKAKIGGKEYTLPNIMSASGARYSDDFSYEFWTKGSELSLTDLTEKSGSKTLSCKELSAKHR